MLGLNLSLSLVSRKLKAIYTGITPSFTASVTSGPAPLAVFLDCTATTSSHSAHGWRDCVFGIDSGDANADTSDYGTRVGQSLRRHLGGPTFGYVYKVPGTYYPTAKMWNGIGYVERVIEVIVTDPDVVFAGANTLACSMTGNYTGKPAGSTDTPVANLAAAIALLATNKRVVLQGADAWTTAASAFLSGTKDNMVFGSFNGRATITLTAAINAFTLNSAGISRLQIMGIDVNGSSLGSKLVQGTTGLAVTGLHIHDVHAYDIGSLYTSSGSHLTNNFTVSDTLVERVKGGGGFVGIFGAASNIIVTNTKVDDATAAEHNLRFQYVGKGYIGHSDFFGPAANKHAMTLRCPLWGGGAGNPSGLPVNSYSEYMTVTHSNFAGNTAQCVTIQPQAPTNDERIRRVIFENNYVKCTGTTMSTGLVITGFECVSRNNVYNMTGGAANIVGITTAANNNFVPDGNESWNDTVYSSSVHTGAASGFTGASGSASNSKLKNMIMYTPLVVGTTQVIGSTAVATTTGTGNTSDANAKTLDPLFVGALTSLAGFALGPGSPYATSANQNTHWYDALDKVRVSNAGAMMLASNATSAWDLFQ